MEKQEEKAVKIRDTKSNSGTENDGTNMPVPDINEVRVYSKSEAALFKQAKNPLGDPHKV
jgi:hypothetical protein